MMRAMALRFLRHPAVRVMCSDAAAARYGKTPLFVVGDKLTQVESVVVPDLDVRDRCEREDVAGNLRARRWPLATDIDKLKRGADYLDWLDREKHRQESELESTRAVLQALLDREKGDTDLCPADREAVEGMKEKMREGRKTLKDLARNRWELEDSVVLPFLDLPNVLHPDCPLEEDRVAFNHGVKPTFVFEPKGHLQVAADEIEMSANSHTAFYLTGRLARLELDLARRAQEHLLNKDFSMVSCPDFCKSLVVEGCGTDFSDPTHEFSLTEAQEFKSRETGQAMHLVGGASLYPFVALFCKNVVINPMVLPQAFFCIGRRYHPVPGPSTDLFQTQQSTAVECFHISAFAQQRDFESVLQVIKDFYTSLEVHFRLVVRAAHRLSAAEGYKVGVELWSPHRSDYVEVGHLSMYGDYLSKRMMLKAEDHDRMMNLSVISGQVIDITKVLACLVECKQDASRNYAI